MSLWLLICVGSERVNMGALGSDWGSRNKEKWADLGYFEADVLLMVWIGNMTGGEINDLQCFW